MSTVSSISTFHQAPRDSALRRELDQRALWVKVADAIVSIFRELVFLLSMLFRAIYGALCGVKELPASMKIIQQPESRGLVVFVHGLRSFPEVWSSQLSLLDQKPVDIFAPHVPEKGMCSLEKAVAPIYPIIRDYAQKNPQKPISLIGHSNGSRIVSLMDKYLREDAPQSPVRVSAIAGVIFGSSRMDQIDSFGIASYFYPQITNELKYGSRVARALLEGLAAPLPDCCAPRSYEFFATPEDLSVPDLDSSLPLLNKGESYHLIPGHSHNSIIAAVAEDQIRACLEWINFRSRSV